eukprot:4768707-Heterocapsa_arctica.AAC.1
MDAVESERQRFVQKRMDARGWAWLASDPRNGFDLDGTPNFGPAYEEWLIDQAAAEAAAAHKGPPLRG